MSINPCLNAAQDEFEESASVTTRLEEMRRTGGDKWLSLLNTDRTKYSVPISDGVSLLTNMYMCIYMIYLTMHAFVYLLDYACICTHVYNVHVNVSAFINPQRVCAEGLRYLSCLCVCLLPLQRQHRSFLRSK